MQAVFKSPLMLLPSATHFTIQAFVLFLSIHCGGANDSIIRPCFLSFLTHRAVSLHRVVLGVLTSFYLSQNEKLQGGRKPHPSQLMPFQAEASELGAIYANAYHLSDFNA